MSGVVEFMDEVDATYAIPGGYIHLRTESEYPALLPYYSLSDDPAEFDRLGLPTVGDRLNTVVANFVGGKLFLTAQPSELTDIRIEQWQRYYEYIDTITVGDAVPGVVTCAQPFGLIVDIGSEFTGLIDIGHSRVVSTPHLPFDHTRWPPVGSRIQCRIEYLRLRDQQIGLGWLPETSVALS
ncbi:MAG: hypothetical protein KDB27_10890 [Planctomycetales bacterium]|nr:hypothetical protein [Planctomycetales bacterium]